MPLLLGLLVFESVYQIFCIQTLYKRKYYDHTLPWKRTYQKTPLSESLCSSKLLLSYSFSKPNSKFTIPFSEFCLKLLRNLSRLGIGPETINPKKMGTLNKIYMSRVFLWRKRFLLVTKTNVFYLDIRIASYVIGLFSRRVLTSTTIVVAFLVFSKLGRIVLSSIQTSLSYDKSLHSQHVFASRILIALRFQYLPLEYLPFGYPPFEHPSALPTYSI